jgi:hypothetical protein
MVFCRLRLPHSLDRDLGIVQLTIGCENVGSRPGRFLKTLSKTGDQGRESFAPRPVREPHSRCVAIVLIVLACRFLISSSKHNTKIRQPHASR